MNPGIDIDARQSDVGQIVALPRQIDEVVLGFGAPIAANCDLNAKSRGPATDELPLRRHNCADVIQDNWVWPQAMPPVT